MFGKKSDREPDCYLYTIFDTKSGSYRDPVLTKDQAEIIRSLQNNFVNPNMQYDQYVTHAEDFQLFKLGSFDRKTGIITAHQPEHVCNLHDLKASRALSAT